MPDKNRAHREMLSERSSLLPDFSGIDLPNIWGNPERATFALSWGSSYKILGCCPEVIFRNIPELGIYFSDSEAILSLQACTIRTLKN